MQVKIEELLELDRECAHIGTMLARDAVLQGVAHLLTDRLGFSAAWLGELHHDRCTLVIRHISGNLTDRFCGLTLRKGCGLGGRVFALGTVQWVDDYFAARTITHDYDDHVASEGIQRVIAAPIVCEGRPIAVLLGGSRDRGTYGAHAAAVLETVAGRTACALIAAERSRRVAESAASDERRRMTLALQAGVGTMLVAITAGARRAGLSGNIDPALRERLLEIERQAGEAVVSLRESLGASPTPRKQWENAHSRIARRESDVLRRVATGETNQQIADELGLSVNTIKTYLRNVMTKLGARNRVEAISRARETGQL